MSKTNGKQLVPFTWDGQTYEIERPRLGTFLAFAEANARLAAAEKDGDLTIFARAMLDALDALGCPEAVSRDCYLDRYAALAGAIQAALFPQTAGAEGNASPAAPSK